MARIDMAKRKIDRENSHIGIGVYAPSQAAKLIRTTPSSIRRWLGGYEHYSPLWAPQYSRLDDRLFLGFLDLMELRFVREFRNYGVSLQHIRQVISKAREIIRRDHPLSTRTFKTDGKDILAKVASETGDHRLLNLRNDQWGFAVAIEPSIVADVVFSDDDLAEQWWPLGRDRGVVVDPTREFGQPILAEFGLPTLMVSLIAKAEGNVDGAVQALEIPLAAVNDALEFEHVFAA